MDILHPGGAFRRQTGNDQGRACPQVVGIDSGAVKLFLAGDDGSLSVDALSYMFGPSFASSDNKKVRIDGFDKLDFDRLNKVLGVEVTPFTDDEIAALGNIEAVLVDWAWFQIYTKLIETRYIENPENLYENTWLHLWRVFSRSIFENCVIFASGVNGVASVAITEAPTVTHGVAGSGSVDVTITTAGLTPKGGERVIYSVAVTSTNGKASISEDGILTWNNAFAADDTIVVTATSAIDSTKTDSETITVS